MSNLITTQIDELATRFDLPQSAELYSVLKATAFKGDVTDAQLSALLIVANQYGLNPWTKEIYAFPDKGGIIPIVGVDGWARIINNNAQFDGMDFDQTAESCTCTIYRKDRRHPTKITEWMAECKKDSAGPWKSHPYRMLRHKAMIQCARMAFGFGGIYDQDEAERIVEASPGIKTIDPTTGEITSKPEAAKLPDYGEDAFATNLPAWQGLIETGKKTAQQIIAMVSTKAILSPEQIAMIEAAENTIEG
jgi:phage recombination protein Bet